MMLRGFTLTGLLFVAAVGHGQAGAQPARPQTEGGVSLPFTFTHVGPGASAWLPLRGGVYDVVERNRPLGCAARLALAGRNEYPVVHFQPNFVPHVPHYQGGARWTGWTAHLVTGSYRIEGQAVSSSCRWSVRISISASS